MLFRSNVSFVALFFCLGFVSVVLAQARLGHIVRRRRAEQLNTMFDTQFSPESQFAHSQFSHSQFMPQTQIVPETRFIRPHQYQDQPHPREDAPQQQFQDNPKYQDHTRFFPEPRSASSRGPSGNEPLAHH